VPDWLELLVRVTAWCPILLLLHEAGVLWFSSSPIVGFTVWFMPGTALLLIGLFGVGLLMQTTEGRR
jgi:hypothetical protein